MKRNAIDARIVAPLSVEGSVLIDGHREGGWKRQFFIQIPAEENHAGIRGCRRRRNKTAGGIDDLRGDQRPAVRIKGDGIGLLIGGILGIKRQIVEHFHRENRWGSKSLIRVPAKEFAASGNWRSWFGKRAADLQHRRCNRSAAIGFEGDRDGSFITLPPGVERHRICD